MILKDAQHLASVGRFEAAREAFSRIVRRQVAAAEYPADALRGLATVEYHLGNTSAAATALDELASQASEFGDPSTQITALLDATLLHQELGRRGDAAQRAQRLRRLLQSPVLPDEVRSDVRSRLVEKN